MFNLMFYGGLILAMICLILSVILFIKNDVGKLIANVTGWSAKFAVMKMNKEKQEKIAKNEKEEKSVLAEKSAKTEKTSKEKTAKKKSRFRLAKEPMADIFQMEEEIMVLAGDKAVKRKPLSRKEQKIVSSELSEVLRSTTPVFDDKNVEQNTETDGEVQIKEKKSTSRSERRRRRLEALNNPETAVLSDEPTDILEEEETVVLQARDLPTDILEEEETDVLQEIDLPTDVLEDEETDILEDEETEVLPEEDEEATSVLSDEEVPTEVLWAVGDEPTDVLEDESTILLYDEEELEGILNSESTVLLQSEAKPTLVLMNDMDEEQPLPDIFDVQETATIVHTDEKIGESQILTDD